MGWSVRSIVVLFLFFLSFHLSHWMRFIGSSCSKTLYVSFFLLLLCVWSHLLYICTSPSMLRSVFLFIISRLLIWTTSNCDISVYVVTPFRCIAVAKIGVACLLGARKRAYQTALCIRRTCTTSVGCIVSYPSKMSATRKCTNCCTARKSGIKGSSFPTSTPSVFV